MWNHHHLFLWSYNTDPYYMNAPHGSLGYNFNDYGQSEKPTWMTNWTLKGECYIWILVTLNNTIHTIPFHLNPNQELIQTNPHWCDNAKDGKPFIDWSAKHYKTLICLTDAFPYQQTSACGTYSSVRQSCGHTECWLIGVISHTAFLFCLFLNSKVEHFHYTDSKHTDHPKV